MPTVSRQCEPRTTRPSVSVTCHPVAVALDRGGPGPAEHGHAPAPEHLLDDHRRVDVLVRQHPGPGGHQRHLGAQRLVGAGELGPGHAGADHDQLFGDLGQVVQLAPVQDPLAVGHRIGQHPGVRAHGQQHGVGGDVPAAGPDRARAGQPPDVVDDLDAFGRDPGRDVPGLGLGQRLDPAVQPLRVGGRAGPGTVSGTGQLDAQVGGAVQHGDRAGHLDQGLGRNAVGEHARATQAVAFGQRHVGPELRGDERGLVAAWPATDNRDPRRSCPHGGNSREVGPAAYDEAT